jgi:hypothetical protein
MTFYAIEFSIFLQYLAGNGIKFLSQFLSTIHFSGIEKCIFTFLTVHRQKVFTFDSTP